LGVDVGGTFTDLVLYNDDTHEMYIHKVPSVPKMPAQGVAKGVSEIVQKAGIPARLITYFIHGTTIPTNAVIERKGAKTGLIVSNGCRDMLEIGRIRMPSPFDLMGEKTKPLVERACVKQVQSRVTPSGEVKQDLSSAEVSSAASELVENDVRSCAICLLNSYVNPALEKKVKSILEKDFPELYISVSSEVWPEIREYERAVVTVLDVYVKQLIDEYLAVLSDDMERLGLASQVYITKSNGGMMTAASARQRPIETMLSGPASGVMGASYIAKLSGVEKALSLDMGGTSADISIITGGEPTYSTEGYVGDFPLIMPSVDVASIGSGGGSIAWVDAMGLLKVGPQSAGADPGPACYGRGGVEPTITDAYLVCGYLNPDNFLGGRVKLSKELAEQAISKVADALSLSTVDAAEGIIRVATSIMLRELYSLMSKVGIDPREYSLIAFGGAGPVHAPLLAEEVGINQVIVPPAPGVLSALGSLITDVRRDAIRTVHKDLSDVRPEELVEYSREMDEGLLSWLRNEGPIVQGTQLMRSADMCYKGQGYEIEVLLSDDSLRASIGELARLFHETHQRVYSHSDPNAPVELINLRTRIIGKSPEVDLGIVRESEERSQATCRGTRSIRYGGSQHVATVWWSEDLRGGNVVVGPAVVEQEDTTILIPPDFAAKSDRRGIMAVTRKGAKP
jgi:N-methylhydantoinase A